MSVRRLRLERRYKEGGEEKAGVGRDRYTEELKTWTTVVNDVW